MTKRAVKIFDVIVIGGGHAGIEAAYAASSFPEISVALITLPGVPIGAAPCNPSIGGVGKGQVAREIDCLGGAMGMLADKSGIHYRTLNTSKGPAVYSTRVQIDKEIYPREALKLLESRNNITIVYDRVIGMNISDTGEESIEIVSNELSYRSIKCIFTLGTFLKGLLHFGEKTVEGGRFHVEQSNVKFPEIFNRLFISRFKTGTPARLNKHSIDYSELEKQASDGETPNLSLLSTYNSRRLEQKSCYLTYTNKKTIDLILENKERSPMFNGQIKGTGARYCPSIEDKAFRYPEKSIHHVFIEPESNELDTVYPSGISTSLPIDIQEKFVKTIKGLESAEILIPGYAVEYEVIDTSLLDLTLSLKDYPNIYFAGQINGTSGYEEAGAQGFIAGINASLAIQNKERMVLSRSDSYIGVLISDLVTSVRDEPYRLFTSRVENRLHIREDNTPIRMLPYRISLGLSQEIDEILIRFNKEADLILNLLKNNYFSSESSELIHLKHSFPSLNVPRRTTLSEILKSIQPEPEKVLCLFLENMGISIPMNVIRAVVFTNKYEGYIKKSENDLRDKERINIKKINVQAVLSSENISFECKERIKRFNPSTFGELRLISGIRPATLVAVAAQL
ncbi:tRNA uridine-5-carboxymethylaminomethyl(34) synthesis enzyme MnmG [Bacteriovoracaceae bacterium]|nr:tRNA uridine-5-carboxymethylaminomethyl(34) synthesis enzyme MnmG [Bacteriovoracaceae bacterium]